MIITTTNTIETHQIKEYLGIVTGETIIGANIFKDFFVGIRDIVVLAIVEWKPDCCLFPRLSLTCSQQCYF